MMPRKRGDAMGHGRAARSINELEIARGVVAALSYSAPHVAKEFHVNAFRSLFEQFADVARYRLGLAAMKLIGEIEPLANGFWLATPVRFVGLGASDLVIAPIPTSRLAFELPGLKTAGFGRVIQHDHNICVPRQSLNSWVRSNTCNPVDLIAFSQAKHAMKSTRTIRSDKFEYFFVADAVFRSRRHRWFKWTSDIRKAAGFSSGMWLCRERVSVAAYRFFLLSRDPSRGYLESPLSEPPTRLQYAIASLLATPAKYAVRHAEKGATAIELATPLPAPEYQIARGLCELDTKKDGVREFKMESEYLPILESRLQALGCERTSHDE